MMGVYALGGVLGGGALVDRLTSEQRRAAMEMKIDAEKHAVEADSRVQQMQALLNDMKDALDARDASLERMKERCHDAESIIAEREAELEEAEKKRKKAENEAKILQNELNKTTDELSKTQRALKLCGDKDAVEKLGSLVKDLFDGYIHAAYDLLCASDYVAGLDVCSRMEKMEPNQSLLDDARELRNYLRDCTNHNMRDRTTRLVDAQSKLVEKRHVRSMLESEMEKLGKKW